MSHQVDAAFFPGLERRQQTEGETRAKGRTESEDSDDLRMRCICAVTDYPIHRPTNRSICSAHIVPRH